MTLQPAPSAPGAFQDEGLQFAFVELPASAAEAALSELNGLCVHELSGTMTLDVRQSKRSLKALQQWQQRQQWREQQRQQQKQRQQYQQQQQQAQQQGLALGSGPAAWEALGEDGSVAALEGPVRRIQKRLVCEGPASSMLWVGNIGAGATMDDVTHLFRRHAIRG